MFKFLRKLFKKKRIGVDDLSPRNRWRYENGGID